MFDPLAVKKYVVESRGQGSGDSLFVSLGDYNRLLEMYKMAAEGLKQIEESLK